MELDYTRIVDGGFPSPIAKTYLFTGNDDALKQEAVQRLIAPLLDPSSTDFDREDIDIGGQAPADGLWATRILASAAGMPMFSDRRIVVVTNVQRLGKEEQESLASGMSKLCDRTCLVMVAATPEYDGGRVKGRSVVSAKLQSAIAKAGTVITCDAPLAATLRTRAAAHLRAVGKSADSGALDIFIQRAVAATADRGGGGKGGDLNVLMAELEKAIAYTGERPLITKSDALAVGTRGATENIFAMLDAVGKKDIVGAIHQVDEMLRCGDKPDGVAARSFVMLARHLRLLWGAKYLAEMSGARARPADSSPAQNPLTAELQGLANQSYRLRNLQDQARKWSYDQLRRGIMRVLASDMTMKGIPPISALEYLGTAGEDPAANLRIVVLELCRMA